MLSFIRFFAVTDGSPLGVIAHEYLKGLIRIAPVRVVSVSGGLTGPWERHVSMTMTPMVGDYVNCVCTHPSSWVSELSVPMPASEDMHGEDAGKIEGHARGAVELYTQGVRNVLFAAESYLFGDVIVTLAQAATAAKYEAIVVSDEDLILGLGVTNIWVIRTPVRDHASMRSAVIGPPPTPPPTPQGPYR